MIFINLLIVTSVHMVLIFIYLIIPNLRRVNTTFVLALLVYRRLINTTVLYLLTAVLYFYTAHLNLAFKAFKGLYCSTISVINEISFRA